MKFLKFLVELTKYDFWTIISYYISGKSFLEERNKWKQRIKHEN